MFLNFNSSVNWKDTNIHILLIEAASPESPISYSSVSIGPVKNATQTDMFILHKSKQYKL